MQNKKTFIRCICIRVQSNDILHISQLVSKWGSEHRVSGDMAALEEMGSGHASGPNRVSSELPRLKTYNLLISYPEA